MESSGRSVLDPKLARPVPEGAGDQGTGSPATTTSESSMSIPCDPVRGAKPDPTSAGLGSDRWGGIVRAGAPHGALVCFAWIDEVSGERLLVEVEGSEEFFLALEDLGFERLSDADPYGGAGSPDPRRTGTASIGLRTLREPGTSCRPA